MRWLKTYRTLLRACMVIFITACSAFAQQITPPNQLHYQGKDYALAYVITDSKSAKNITDSWPSAVTLKTLGTDRYGMPRVLVYDAQNRLLQQQWIQQGDALAYATTPDETMTHLLHFPVGERWHIEAQQAHDLIGNYRQVRVKIHAVTITKQHAFLNSGEDWKKDFTIYIPLVTLRKMNRTMLENLNGKWVKVRGLITWHYGPSIALLNPDMMEVEDVDSD